MKKENVIKIVSSCFDYFKQFSFSEKLIRRNPLYYASAQTLFTSLKNEEFEERKTKVNLLLNNSLKLNTPHIKEFEASLHGLKVLPLINKQRIQENVKKFLGPWNRLSVPSSTGGSTGVPLSLYRSFPSIVIEQAAIDSAYKENGVEPLNSKIVVLRGDTVKDANEFEAPYWKYNANGRILKLSSHHMNADTICHYLDELESFNPDVIYAYPSAIEFFAHLVAQSEREFNVPLVVTSSEVFTSQSRNKVSGILGCVTCDYYGQAERISFAYSNKVDEYYFLPGYSYVELEYKYSEDDQDYYEVIGTSFWNNAMSLQRYCTGDLAILPKDLSSIEVEQICYGMKPFNGILGRTSEYLLTPEGQQLIGINQIPKFVNSVVQMQFVQNSLDQVDIYVVPDNNYDSENEAEIIKNARKKIPSSVTISVIVTDTLEKTKSHKTPLVIRRI